MQYNIIPIPKSEVEIQVTVTIDEFETHVKKAAALISEEMAIDGFRKGKAPYEIVKNKVGEMAIYERAAELAVHVTYTEIVAQLTANDQQRTTNFIPIGRPAQQASEARPIVPIGRPEITIIKLAPGNELQYKVKIAVLPEVKLPDYKEIAKLAQKEKKTVSVSDEEVEKTIDWLRESRTALITVDRPAKIGDRVEIDFEVRHAGVKIENGESRNHPLIIGKGNFLPGFEDALLYMKAGEEKTFSLTAPENWHEKSLTGKTLDFNVTVKLVQERKVPELTDEFVKTLGNFSSVEAFKTNVREWVWQEKEKKERSRLRAVAIEEVAKQTKIDVPDVLITAELEKMLGELKSGTVEMGMKWEDYLLHIKKTADDLKKEWLGESEKRVRIALCLREIARLEKIEPSEEEIKARADKLLAQYKNTEEAEENIDVQALREYTVGILRNEKVFEFLEKISE